MEQQIKDILNLLNIKYNEIQVNQLISFYNLLIETNKVMNLTRITSIKEYVIKHIYDSLYPLITTNLPSSIIDIGSGAGFPGIVLKIIYPEINIVLVESINKKANFLKQVITRLNLENIIVLPKRSEQLLSSDLPFKEVDLITLRAVAPMVKISLLIPKFITRHTQIFCYKGLMVKDEITIFNHKPNPFKIIKTHNYDLPNNYGTRNLVILQKK